MIRNMKDRGMSNREIANEPGISRNTVRKMIKATGIPDPKRRKRASRLDPYSDVSPLNFGQIFRLPMRHFP